MTIQEKFEELLPKMSGDNLNDVRGAQQKWQEICFAAGAPGNEEDRATTCQLMAAHVDNETPQPARIWLLEQLNRIGGAESVEAIADAADTKDAEVQDAAVRALTNNSSPTANAVLLAKLGTASGRSKIAVINALGYRADGASVNALSKELSNSEDAIAIAAAKALGKIADASAEKSLAAARTKADGEVRRAIGDAQLLCADQLQAAGKKKEAGTIYNKLNIEAEPTPIRTAAELGLSNIQG